MNCNAPHFNKSVMLLWPNHATKKKKLPRTPSPTRAVHRMAKDAEVCIDLGKMQRIAAIFQIKFEN
jgi:hypothetical protein